MALAVVWSNKMAIRVKVGKMKRLWSMVKGMDEDILVSVILVFGRLRLMPQIKLLRCERAKIKHSRPLYLPLGVYVRVCEFSICICSRVQGKIKWEKTFARARFSLYTSVWQSFLVSFSSDRPKPYDICKRHKNNTRHSSFSGAGRLGLGASWGSDWIIVGTSAAALQCPVARIYIHQSNL